MSQDCVVAVYQTSDKGHEAVRALESAGFPADQVSLVTHSVEDEAPEKDALAGGDKTERNAVKGAAAGGLLAALLSTPLMTIGGIGAVLIAGPVAMGLAGAVVGGFLGAMSGWGVRSDQVRRYEDKVSSGALLVIVNGTPRETAKAEKILQKTAAAEVHLHAESTADDVDP